VGGEAAICSAALIELGEDRITSLTQDAERARIMRELYPAELDALLSEHPWNFALARVELAQSAEAPAFGFARAFVLPADCLAVVEVSPVEASWKVEAGRLLADEAAVAVRYVRRVADPAAMPPCFRAVLAARLAARAAKRITGSSAEKERMEGLAAERLRTAKGRDAQGSGSPESPGADLFIRARR